MANNFGSEAARWTGLIVESAGLDGYTIDAAGMADDLEDKARELAALIRQGSTPDQGEVGGPLVDLHQMVQGMLNAYPQLP
jgi:hypothetical protein